IDVRSKHFDQCRIVNRNTFSIGSLNIDNQLCEIRYKRIRVSAFRLDQVNGTRRFVRMTKSRTILQKLSLLASCEIRKSVVIRRASEGKEAIAVDSRVTCKSFVQLFATHAFDGITPKTLNLSNDPHECKPIFKRA